jgi:hypothetical protein
MTQTTTTDETVREMDEKRHPEIRAFNAIYADYLEVRAAMLRGSLSDEEIDKLNDCESELIWKVIGAPAATRDQLAYKFDVMRGMVAPNDDAPLEMLESIRRDALANWENWEWTPLPFDDDKPVS